MTEQPDLFGGEVLYPGTPAWVWDYLTPEQWQEFRDWQHTAHGGEVSNLFLRYALQMRRRGWSHFGAEAIVNRLRWEQAMQQGPDADGFKINNNYRRRLAIWAMIRHRELEGFFHLRNRLEEADTESAGSEGQRG